MSSLDLEIFSQPLRVILKKIGLVPEKDVAIIQIGSSPVRMAALANGVADGTALTFEEMMIAKKMGFNVLLNLMEFGVEALNSDVVTTRRFIRESRDTVQRFIKGIIKGVNFFPRTRNFPWTSSLATPRARMLRD